VGNDNLFQGKIKSVVKFGSWGGRIINLEIVLGLNRKQGEGEKEIIKFVEGNVG